MSGLWQGQAGLPLVISCSFCQWVWPCSSQSVAVLPISPMAPFSASSGVTGVLLGPLGSLIYLWYLVTIMAMAHGMIGSGVPRGQSTKTCRVGQGGRTQLILSLSHGAERMVSPRVVSTGDTPKAALKPLSAQHGKAPIIVLFSLLTMALYPVTLFHGHSTPVPLPHEPLHPEPLPHGHSIPHPYLMDPPPHTPTHGHSTPHPCLMNPSTYWTLAHGSTTLHPCLMDPSTLHSWGFPRALLVALGCGVSIHWIHSRSGSAGFLTHGLQ